jgi:tetratricopeptide (TPR) repeat protein
MNTVPCIRRSPLALRLIAAWVLLANLWMFQSTFAAPGAASTTPSSTITLQVLPKGTDTGTQVQIDAANQPVNNVARALLATGALRFEGIEVLSDAKATFRFPEIHPASLLGLIADSGGAALTYRRDGTIVLRRKVSDPEHDALIAQFETSFDSPEALTKALIALRKLEAPRSDGKLAPTSDYLAELSMHYKSAGMFDDWVALQREILAAILQRDARPDSLATAQARAALAVALYASNQPLMGETELRQAWPVLQKNLANIDAGGAAFELAELLLARGRTGDAQQLFQHVFDNLYAVDTDVWVWQVLPAARALLGIYRDHDNPAARKLLTRWRAQVDQLETYPWADRSIEWEFTGTLDVNAFAQKVDIETALMPSWSRVSTDQLNRWLRLMMQRDLHAGHFARAAQMLAVVGDSHLACGGKIATESERKLNQATLQRLRDIGDVSPAGSSLRPDMPAPKWRCPEASATPSLHETAPVYQTYLDQVAVSILYRAEAIKPNLALVEAAEHAAIAIETLESVRAELLGKARAWRKTLGHSPAQIAKRDAWIAEQLQKTQKAR